MVNSSISIKECGGVYRPDDDTYLLIRSISIHEGERVLEVGCGTGIVAIHCARAGAVVDAVDIDPQAVDCARANIAANRVGVRVWRSDALENVDDEYDTIVWNLPYLPVSEKGSLALAWSGGEGGVEPLRRLLGQSPDRLRPGGRIIVVVSSRMDPDLLKTALEGWCITTIGEERLFFERLTVLELTPEVR